MNEYSRTEIAVGGFMIAGGIALGFLSFSLGGLELFRAKGDRVGARFASVGTLGVDAPVKIAGVRVGKVLSIRLQRYVAEVELRIDPGLELPADTVASIRTTGLLGEAFVALSPGGASEVLKDGGRIEQTEPAIDLIDLVAKYAFGSGKGGGEKDPLGPGE